MTTTNICLGITAAQNPPGEAQGGPPGSSLPPGSQVADLSKTGAGTPVSSATNATWHVTLTTTIGAGPSCSCTFTPLVSNDGFNWTGGGIAPIVIAAGPAVQQATATVTGNFAYYSGYFSAIAATGATPSGKCVLNA